jgi:hypothetical protein
MIALRTAIHFITGEPVDRDTRRARLLAARRKPIGNITRRGILSGHWDQGSVVGAFRGKLGSFNSRPPLKSRRSPQAGERRDSVNRDLGVPLMK